MDKNIENEINLTLQCLGDSDNVRVSSSFVDSMAHRLEGVHPRRGLGNTNRSFYSAIIALMVLLNITAFFVNLKSNQQAAPVSSSHADVLAEEYSIGQNSLASF